MTTPEKSFGDFIVWVREGLLNYDATITVDCLGLAAEHLQELRRVLADVAFLDVLPPRSGVQTVPGEARLRFVRRLAHPEGQKFV